MRDPNALTPQQPELTDAMKAFIRHQLAEVPTTVPYRLYSVIVAKVDKEKLPGPAPYRRQVDNYVRFWRRANPTDEMARVIDMCDQHLYDEVGMHPEAPTNLVILCDTNIAGGRHVSSVGCGNDAAPFRVGLTCYKLFKTMLMCNGLPTKRRSYTLTARSRL
ncbi:hypothetical protein GN244_ATG13657 [Phytophthora infestans]|uniref:Uncharacterized protein n=1 Tax=Phytophthora infestans TaxID=4787 RepID=A0A833SJF2_PHYIN|nr:hypothetical protein GN244_ATG13657 [Phytophthora infestans]